MVTILALIKFECFGLSLLLDVIDVKLRDELQKRHAKNNDYSEVQHHCPDIPVVDEEELKVTPYRGLTYRQNMPKNLYQLTFNKNASTNQVELPFDWRRSGAPYGLIRFFNRRQKAVHWLRINKDTQCATETTKNKGHPALTDQSLLALSKKMTYPEWMEIGINLGIPWDTIERLLDGQKSSISIFKILKFWKSHRGSKSDMDLLEELSDALHDIQRNDVADLLSTAMRANETLRKVMRESGFIYQAKDY